MNRPEPSRNQAGTDQNQAGTDHYEIAIKEICLVYFLCVSIAAIFHHKLVSRPFCLLLRKK